MREQLRAAWEFFLAMVTRFREERATQTAGSLTYTSLLSMVPLLTVALAITTAFPVFDEAISTLHDGGRQSTDGDAAVPIAMARRAEITRCPHAANLPTRTWRYPLGSGRARRRRNAQRSTPSPRNAASRLALRRRSRT